MTPRRTERPFPDAGVAATLQHAAEAEADRRLLADCRAGDTAAVERLVARHADRTYAVALVLSGAAERAEEIVRDLFEELLHRPDLRDTDGPLGRWLVRAAARAALEREPQAGPHPFMPAAPEPSPLHDDRDGRPAEGSPGARDELPDAARASLRQALAALPARDRAAVVLRDGVGCASEEVAEALGEPVARARARLHRARTILRDRLAAAFEPEPPRRRS